MSFADERDELLELSNKIISACAEIDFLANGDASDPDIAERFRSLTATVSFSSGSLAAMVRGAHVEIERLKVELERSRLRKFIPPT